MKNIKSLNLALASKKIELLRPSLEGAKIHPGWICFIRKTIGMTYKQLAERANVKPTSVKDAEKSEEKGKISIESLKKYAEAMDCELVYGLIPKKKLEDLTRDAAREKAISNLKEANLHMELEGQGIDISETQIELEMNRIMWTKEVWE